MPSRYIVAPGQEFNYPADKISEQTVKAAGGRSKMSDDARANCKFKTVKEGEDCSDMPTAALGLYVERGWVIDSQSTRIEKERPAVVEQPSVAEPTSDAAPIEEAAPSVIGETDEVTNG